MKQKAALAYQDIDGLARRGKTGKMLLEADDWETVSGLAKAGILTKFNADEMKKALDSTTERLEKERAAYHRMYEQARPCLDAVKIAPEQTQAALDSVVRQAQEQSVRQQSHKRRSGSLSR